MGHRFIVPDCAPTLISAKRRPLEHCMWSRFDNARSLDFLAAVTIAIQELETAVIGKSIIDGDTLLFQCWHCSMLALRGGV